jgi:hypothetical protein
VTIKELKIAGSLSMYAVLVLVAKTSKGIARMFLRKKPDQNPRGVPLDDLQKLLSTTTLKISRDAESLIAEHATAITKLKVIPPAGDEASEHPLQAVVQITTELPDNLISHFTPLLPILNKMAVLGAMTVENGRCFIGSRLTVFKEEKAWELYIPFLLFTVVSGSESHLGAIRRTVGGEEARKGKSLWTVEDFDYAQAKLSQFCVCTGGGLGLTAEFALQPGETSAALGDHLTALWELKAGAPHPELGGGLLCILQMPHRVAPDRIADILLELNREEMAPRDRPPHFGAWCQGHSESTLAYISFLPNVMHRIAGVALNVSIWAQHRAGFANAYLASLGVYP